MKMILATALLLLSASVLADNQECNSKSVAQCGDAPPGQIKQFATVPSPGTLALVSLGVVGLVIARKKKG
jgi:hypothetical protein